MHRFESGRRLRKAESSIEYQELREGMGKSPKYASFEDMPVWKLAYDFVFQIYKITKTYPTEEKYGLTSDTRRAAVSIPSNIAEAFGRFHYKDKLNFYYNSRGSTTEVINHLHIGRGLGYCPEGDFLVARKSADIIWGELNKIISTLSK